MNQLMFACISLVSMTACTTLPFFWQVRPSELVGNGRAELEMHDVHYDGEALSGRLLIGAVGGNLHVDRRLIPNTVIEVDAVSDCTAEYSVPSGFFLTDSFPSKPRQEDILTLKPGEWYGKKVRFFLFSERLGHPGPDCIEARFSFDNVERETVGQLSVRAVRVPQHILDANTSSEESPATP